MHILLCCLYTTVLFSSHITFACFIHMLFIVIAVTVMDKCTLRDLNDLDKSLIVLSNQSYMPFLMNSVRHMYVLSVQFPSVIHEFSPCTSMLILNFDNFFLYESGDACTYELHYRQRTYGLESAFRLQHDFLDLCITTLNFLYNVKGVYPSLPHTFVITSCCISQWPK